MVHGLRQPALAFKPCLSIGSAGVQSQFSAWTTDKFQVAAYNIPY